MKNLSTTKIVAILLGVLTATIIITLTLIYAETFLLPQLEGILVGVLVAVFGMLILPDDWDYTYPLRKLIK
jgi:hypothetical protein